MITDLVSLDDKAMEELVSGLGCPRYRARQLSAAVLRGAYFDEMLELPASLREELKKISVPHSVGTAEVLTAPEDGTRKFLFSLYDGNIIEGVLMKYKYGYTLCVSTQVGCAMGCSFCASTKAGLVRNLYWWEMMGQVLEANRALGAEGRVGHIVLMGSGEPLDNYDNTVAFLKNVNQRLGIGIRNISLSTCGLPDKIARFTKEELPVTLSLSLHAPDDIIRKSIMPVARAYPLESVLEKVWDYTRETGRRAIMEYAMIRGVNDGEACARELASLLAGRLCHVNLIPVNPIEERDYRPSDDRNIQSFIKILAAKGVTATRRREMGASINGACGQLRRRYIENGNSIGGVQS